MSSADRDARIAAIEAQLDGATQWPWKFASMLDPKEFRGFVAKCGDSNAGPHYVLPLPGTNWKPDGAQADAEFIASAPASIAWLIAELREAKKDAERLVFLAKTVADAEGAPFEQVLAAIRIETDAEMDDTRNAVALESARSVSLSENG